MSASLQPQGLYSPWNSPGQNIGVGSLSLLQGVFPTQESNQGLLHGRQILYQLSYQGSPTQRLNFVQVNKEIQSETRNSVYQNELDECETI